MLQEERREWDADPIYRVGVSDADKVSFGFKNAAAHVAGYNKLGVTIGENAVDLKVVLNGFSFTMVMKEGGEFNGTEWEAADEATIALVDNVIALGGKVYMCANTAAAVGFTVDDLIDGFELADYGATVMIAQLQGMGYSYVRS